MVKYVNAPRQSLSFPFFLSVMSLQLVSVFPPIKMISCCNYITQRNQTSKETQNRLYDKNNQWHLAI